MQTTPQPGYSYEDLLCGAFEAVAGEKRGVFLSPIPASKLTNAERYALCPLREEKPVVLIDSTALGSAKRGVLFTDRACHYHTDLGRGSFRYEHIVGARDRTGFPSYELTVVLRSGNTHTLPFPNKHASTAAERFVAAAIDKSKGISASPRSGEGNGGRGRCGSPHDLRARLHQEFTRRCQRTAGVYIAGVPQAILDAVKRSFPARLDEGEEPLVLVDPLPLNESYEDGVLFTDRACYYRSRQASGRFAYSGVQRFYTDASETLKSLSVLTSDGMLHPLRFLSDDAFRASESVFCAIAEKQTASEGSEKSEKEYACPRCEAILYWDTAPSASSSLLGGAFVSAAKKTVSRLRCPKCGPIPDKELSAEDQKSLAKERTGEAARAAVIAVIIVLITLLFIALRSSCR